MKVLFVNLTPFYGGGEVYLRHLIAGLRQRGVDVALHSVPGPLPDLLRPEHPDMAISLSRARSYLSEPLLALEVRRLARATGADVVHMNGKLHLGWLLAGVPAIRVVTYHLDSPALSRPALRRLYGLLLRASGRVLTRVICVCDHYRLQLQSWLPPARLCTVHNGVAVPPEPPAPPAEFTVLMVARLVAIKGHELLFAAVRRLVRERGLALRVICLGDGPDRARYQSLIREWGLEAVVELVGFAAEPGEWYARASVVVLPSWHEGLPLSLLEAMAWARPVIATTVAGVPEMVSHGQNGFLIGPGDGADLEERLAFLAGHPKAALRMGMEARRTIARDFSGALMVERTLAVYQACLAER